MKRRLILALAALMVVAAPIISRSLWLPLPGRWLDASDPLERADIIFILSGQAFWRVKTAARLYHQQYAPRIVATGGEESDLLLLVTGERIKDTEIIRRMLVALRVPAEAMAAIDGVTSTRDDAEAFARYVRAHGVRSAIVVTSHLHSRRARWTFRRVLDDETIRLHFVEADQPHVAPATWWTGEDGVVTVFNEYVKFGYYLLHY